MQFLKALLAPASVSAALALSAVVLGPATVTFAFLLNCFVLSQVAGLPPFTSATLPESYFRLRPVERGGRIYLYLGIQFFKRMMMSKLYRKLNPYFNFKRTSITPRDLMNRMKDAEAAHALVFGLMLLCSLVALVVGSSYAAFWLLFFNMIGNGYPVMLQRYNRGRLERIFGEDGGLRCSPSVASID